MKNNYIVTAVVAVIVGVAAFFAGSHFASPSQSAGASGAARFSRIGAAGARIFNGSAGTIVSVTGNNLTIQMQDGSSKVVFFDPSVPIAKTVPGSLSDLKAGTTVFVMGSANSDGSLTAQSIQIRPLSTGPQNSTGTSTNSSGTGPQNQTGQ